MFYLGNAEKLVRLEMTDEEKITAAKAELNEYYSLFVKAKNTQTVLQEVRSRMTTLQGFQGGERVSSGKKRSDRLEYYIDRCVRLEAKLAAQISAMLEKQSEILDRINLLSGISADILHKRYIERKRFEVIAVEMNYEYRYIKKLHKRALLQYMEKMTPFDT